MSLQYRADVDGLRALAVIPVVLFHVGLEQFSGGFVGVDVFFVISGFLITSIIVQETREGTFSYVDFWERRARRLIAPIVVVTAATMAVAAFFFLPEEMQSLSQSVVALSVFCSNIFFWLKSGYFAAPDDTVPLLHTWSLAVEEQFYLFFPLVLIALASRSTRTHVVVILGIAVVSLIISEWQVRSSPDAAYYLLPSRAFELMFGALLAIGQVQQSKLPKLAVDGLLLLGIALVVVPILTYSKATPFPGVAALLPVAGTVLLLWFGHGGASHVSKVFCHPWVVYVGKLSYSLYLWHWPVIVLWKEWSGTPIVAFSELERVVLIAVSVVLSIVSYVLVENPIRRRRVFASRTAIFTAAGGSLALLGAIGLVGHFTNGFEARVPNEVRSVVALRADWSERQFSCADRSSAQVRAGELCQLGSDEAEIDFVVWGDSHAQTVLESIDAAATAVGRAGKFVSMGGCLPTENDGTLTERCAGSSEAALSYLKESQPPLILLIARWSAYPPFTPTPSAASRQAFTNTLRTLEASGARIVVMDEVPYDPAFSLNAFGVSVWRGLKPEERALPLAAYQSRNVAFDTFMNAYQQSGTQRLSRVSPIEYLCEGALCPAYREGTLYKDSNHLTRFGAERLVPLFQGVLVGQSE